MARLVSFVFIISSFTLQAQETKAFDWLIGKWERSNVKAGKTAFEIWGWDNEAGLKGIGVTLQGADTVFLEQLSIVTKGSDVFYVANVSSNASPTYFKVTSITNSGFVSENPEHDFPKKITYALDGDVITATISGDGKEIPFLFKKVE